MRIRTVLRSLPIRILGDLLLRYFAVYVITLVYLAMIILGNLRGVLPSFYGDMGTYHLDLMLPLFFVQVPIWCLVVTVISIWKKSWWIEIVGAQLIVALLWWILPAVSRELAEPVMIWDQLFVLGEHERLAHYILSTTTFMLMSMASLVIVALKGWRGVYNSGS